MRNERLQEICRQYLARLRHTAGKHGLSSWLSSVIAENRRGECSATEREVSMLSRLVDDERVERKDIPKILGKSYRQCVADGDFDRIRHLKRTGIYSKVSLMLNKKKD